MLGIIGAMDVEVAEVKEVMPVSYTHLDVCKRQYQWCRF